MNSKTRGILLSVFAVLFAAASVFAITAEDLAGMLTTDSELIYTDTYTEGYNYKQRFYVDTSGLEAAIGTVSWEVYPAYDWLKWHIGSDDKNIIFEGVLPAYDTESADANTYTIHTVAHISGDIVSYDSEGTEIYVSGDISADVEYNSGLQITVDQLDTSSYWLSQFTDFVSYDTSALSEARKDDYSVTLTFKTSIDLVPDYLYVSDDSGNWMISEDDDGNYVLKSQNKVEGSSHVMLPLTYDSSDLETFAGVFNLPAWLGYKVISTQVEDIFDVDYNTWTSGDYVYVKELEIFYSEDRRVYPEGSEPEDGTKGVVLIGIDESSLAFNDDYRGYIDPDGENASYDATPIIKWDVSYSRIPPIKLESSEVTFPVSYDSSADMTVKFYTQLPSGDITFTPDISQYVKLSADWKAANSTEYSGDITIHATPVAKANAVYSTDMIVTDTNGLSAALRLNISVDVPVIKLSYDYNGEKYPHMSTAPFKFDNPDIHTEWWYAKPISIDLSMIPAGLNVTAISLDGTSGGNVKHGAIWLFYAPVVEGSWDGKIKVYDEYGGSADLMMSLRTEVTSADMTTSVTVSGDTSETPSIYSGQSATLLISAKDSYGPVKWTLDNAAELYALGITLTQTASTDSTAVYTLTTPAGLEAGTYEAHISAEDGIGRKAVAYTFTITVKDWPITLSGDFASIDVVYPASGEATVQYYYAEFVSWSMSPDISADISFDITSIPAESTDSTTAEGVISVAATPLTASEDTYTTTLYFTDKNGNTASRDITINVTLTDFEVTPSAASLSIIEGMSADVTFIASGNVGLVTWTLGEIPDGIRVTLSDIANATAYGSIMSYVVIGSRAGSYSFNITAEDTAGRTSTVAVYVTVSAKPAPGTFAVSPSAPSVTVNVGESQNVSLTASNNSGLVTWTLGTVPSGVTVAPAEDTSYATREMTTMVYTVKGVTAGTYSVPVTATDAAGNTSSAEISITVSPVGMFVVSPSAPSVTVNAGSSQNVSLTASGNSGLVTWTLGTVPSGVTVAPAEDTSYATREMTTMIYTVTGVTAGSYSVTVTATDAAGNSAAATISVTVSSSGGGGGKIDTPTIDITDDTVQSTIKQSLFAKLGSKITSSTEIATLPSSATSGTVSYVGTNTVYIPTIVVEVAKIYVFGVSLDNLAAGSLMTWTPHVSSSSTGEYLEASAEEENATFLDDSGNEVTRVPANKHVNVAAYFEPGKTYSPTITTASSKTLEVVGSSSSGCSAGLGALVSVLAAAFFISKKRS